MSEHTTEDSVNPAVRDGSRPGDDHRHVKEYIFEHPDPVDPNPIIGWSCWCGVTEYYDDDQIAGLLP